MYCKKGTGCLEQQASALIVQAFSGGMRVSSAHAPLLAVYSCFCL
jgi:hypothetical protein